MIHRGPMCGRMNQLSSFSSFLQNIGDLGSAGPFCGRLIRQALYQNFGTSSSV